MATLPTLTIMRTDNPSTFKSQDAPGKDFAKWVRRPGMYDTKYNITGTMNEALWRADLKEWNLKAQQSQSQPVASSLSAVDRQNVNGFVVVVKYLVDKGIPKIYSTADKDKINALTYTLLSGAPIKGTDTTNAPSAIGTYNWALGIEGAPPASQILRPIESCYWTEEGRDVTEANGGAGVRGRRVMVSKLYVSVPTTILDPDFGQPGHPYEYIQVNPSPTL